MQCVVFGRILTTLYVIYKGYMFPLGNDEFRRLPSQDIL